MREKSISQLAYDLKQVKGQKSKAIFFLGAGASVTGSIPLAKDIAREIQVKYADNPSIGDIPENERTYSKLMDCLQVRQRQLLLKNYIDNAKINVTHIYLAQLMAEGFVDYVLTVNFDNLMLRALALYNIFPPTYDMAILKDLTTTNLKENSVVYLHGQHHGLWLLNTHEEMKKVREVVPCIFHSIKNARPWVFIGYSGDDPIFEHIKKLGRFDDGCYWVAYNDNDPGKNVLEFLNEENRNASIIKGFDADAFMLKLNNALGLPQPAVLDKPFTMLKERILEIVDIDDKEQFKGVKERLEISKRWIDQSIDLFEENKIKEIEEIQEKQNVERLKKEIVAILSSEQFDENTIDTVEERVLKYGNEELYALTSNIYFNWGNFLGYIAVREKGSEAEKLYYQAFAKYQKAIEIKPDKHEAYYNWGIYLGKFAEKMEGSEMEDLCNQAFEKFQHAVEIKPVDHEAYYNWGTYLGMLAEKKEGSEMEDLCNQAFEKFQHAIEIRPVDYESYNNWGTYLGKLAEKKEGSEAENLCQQAFEKFQKAIEIKPDRYEAYNNWGTCLGVLAEKMNGAEAEKFYHQAFEKYQEAIKIRSFEKKVYYNWANLLCKLAEHTKGEKAEIHYNQAFVKYQKIIEIQPDDPEAYYNWGYFLSVLAKQKEDLEAENLYYQAFAKYKKAIELKPDYYEVYNNWGINLSVLANQKEGSEADNLHQQGFAKYQKMIEIKPEKHVAYENWGVDLLYIGKKQNANVARVLFQEAVEKCQKAYTLGGSCYNLSCAYALLKNTQDALNYLNISLSKKEISIEHVRNDDDWKEYQNDGDFKATIAKYNNKPELATTSN